MPESGRSYGVAVTAGLSGSGVGSNSFDCGGYEERYIDGLKMSTMMVKGEGKDEGVDGGVDEGGDEKEDEEEEEGGNEEEGDDTDRPSEHLSAHDHLSQVEPRGPKPRGCGEVSRPVSVRRSAITPNGREHVSATIYPGGKADVYSRSGALRPRN